METFRLSSVEYLGDTVGRMRLEKRHEVMNTVVARQGRDQNVRPMSSHAGWKMRTRVLEVTNCRVASVDLRASRRLR